MSEGNGDAVEVRVDFDRLAGEGGDAATRVVVDLRITGSVRVRRETGAGR